MYVKSGCLDVCLCLLNKETEEKSEDLSFIPIMMPSAFRDNEKAGKHDMDSLALVMP